MHWGENIEPNFVQQPRRGASEGFIQFSRCSHCSKSITSSQSVLRVGGYCKSAWCQARLVTVTAGSGALSPQRPTWEPSCGLRAQLFVTKLWTKVGLNVFQGTGRKNMPYLCHPLRMSNHRRKCKSISRTAFRQYWISCTLSSKWSNTSNHQMFNSADKQEQRFSCCFEKFSRTFNTLFYNSQDLPSCAQKTQIRRISRPATVGHQSKTCSFTRSLAQGEWRLCLFDCEH